MNLKIFNFYFKNTPLIENDKYIIPIQCGKDISNIELKMEADNTGDNISKKNPYFSELTGTYWIWKNYNLNSVTHIGVCHYRRKFNVNYLDKIIQKNTDFDIIMPKKIKLGSLRSIEAQFSLAHNKEDFVIMKNYMKKYFPNYDISILSKKKIPYINNSMYAFNMFIMKKDLFIKYCDFIFKVLFDLEKEIKPSDDNYQKRVFGYLGERLLNVFINDLEKKGYKIIECELEYL